MDIETVLLDRSTGSRIRRSTVQRTRVTWTDEELDTLAVLAATVEVEIDVPPTITEAVATGRSVSSRYRDAEGVETDRVIEPW